MATAFGLMALRTKLADWRGNWKSRGPSDGEVAVVEPIFKNIAAVHKDSDISRLIENQVIPRLVANQTMKSRAASNRNAFVRSDARGHHPSAAVFSDSDIHEFARLSVRDNPEAMLDFIDLQLDHGHSVETVYVELLAPAARKLGKDWEDDRQDFVDVTMGLWRIQEILRELSSRIPPKAGRACRQRSALFSPLPGEQHSLGTLMIGECFERAGWSTEILIEPTQSELNVQCAGQHYDLVGLTVSCDCSTGSLRSLVNTIKSISGNPDIRILLGGRFINEHPDLVRECGADGTAIDAMSALALAERLVPVKMEMIEPLL
jgi:MerR family transcriptional regulator, light-induced transcriptional regulator